MSKMPDPLDVAAEIEQRERDAALENARLCTEPEQHIVDDEVLCIDCHDAIPPMRLIAKPHAARCVFCQQISEREGK